MDCSSSLLRAFSQNSALTIILPSLCTSLTAALVVLGRSPIALCFALCSLLHLLFALWFYFSTYLDLLFCCCRIQLHNIHPIPLDLLPPFRFYTPFCRPFVYRMEPRQSFVANLEDRLMMLAFRFDDLPQHTLCSIA